ncbi:MAG: hypothetical protein K0S03_451, partial [Burkholderiales bacterium]|nr:hypothetical protein [Burkholderiales bacterium]
MKPAREEALGVECAWRPPVELAPPPP